MIMRVAIQTITFEFLVHCFLGIFNWMELYYSDMRAPESNIAVIHILCDAKIVYLLPHMLIT